MGIYFYGILDPATVQVRTKFPSLITNVILQFVKDIINGVRYQRCEKRLEQHKRSSKCSCLRCRRKFERGTIIKSVFDFIVSNKIRTLIFFVRNINFLGFYSSPSPGFRSRGDQNLQGGATFFKYNIGCMQQPGGQT